jgi:hypothetical protein
MKFLRKMYETVHDIVMISLILAIGILTLKAFVELMAPTITLGLVLLGTNASFEKRLTAILSIGGLVLYAASWPTVTMWGVWPGMMVWTLGMLMWFSGVFRPFPCLQTVRTT